MHFRICYTESIGVEDDQYPPNIAVLVNGLHCAVQVTHDSLHISNAFKWLNKGLGFVCVFLLHSLILIKGQTCTFRDKKNPMTKIVQ